MTVIAVSFGSPGTKRRSTTLSRAATVSHSSGSDPDGPVVIENGVGQRVRDLCLIDLARPVRPARLGGAHGPAGVGCSRAPACSTPCCGASTETRRRTRHRSRRDESRGPASVPRASPCWRRSTPAGAGRASACPCRTAFSSAPSNAAICWRACYLDRSSRSAGRAGDLRADRSCRRQDEADSQPSPNTSFTSLPPRSSRDNPWSRPAAVRNSAGCACRSA